MKLVAAITLRIGFLLSLITFLMVAQASHEDQPKSSDRPYLDTKADQ